MESLVSYKQTTEAHSVRRWTEEVEVRSPQLVWEIGTLLENAGDDGFEITQVAIEKDKLREMDESGSVYR